MLMNDDAKGDGVTISEVCTVPEIEDWQATEAIVWSGDPEVHKTSLLVTIQKYGGLLLGARDSSGAMIGVLLGFPGLKDGKPIHCSHQLGILPEWRSKHVGYRMKCRQREFVLAQGLTDLVVWTFDPLETRNAHLNIGHLGGICHQYHPNLYGIMDDNLNHGMETDRLTLAWHLRHPLVTTRLEGSRPSPRAADLLRAGVPVLSESALIAADPDSEPYLRLTGTITGQDAPVMLLEVPSNFQAIKHRNQQDAHAWRYGVRDVLTDLFTRGYAVLDFLVDVRPGQLTRCYYLIGRLESFLKA